MDAAAVAAGWAHTCVLTRSGAVKCWGYNKNGELGNGKTADSSTPVEVSGLAAGVVSIGTNEDHTCAVTADGAVYAGVSINSASWATGRGPAAVCRLRSRDCTERRSVWRRAGATPAFLASPEGSNAGGIMNTGSLGMDRNRLSG